MSDEEITKSFAAARDRYAEVGVDAERALSELGEVELSLHCWQGDDVSGFESPKAILSGGGIRVTGSYPGRARTVAELRDDLEFAYSLIPGRHRLNLHAIYGEFGSRGVDRDRIEPGHFQGWIDWAKEKGLGLDFNCTCFSHPKAASGSTLSSADPAIRIFWIEHVKRCRRIAARMGQALGRPAVHNLWIPDGAKNETVERWPARQRLLAALDDIYAAGYPPEELIDSLEGKIFGIGSESFVVGSHEFYLGYALTRGKMICLDLGHFHPTEAAADKISALLNFCPGLLVHVSRGVRWDSDHVVLLTDEIRALGAEIVRAGALARVRLALDFFDASLNRIGAWVIGSRATQKGLLLALLEPVERLRQYERENNHFAAMALAEELKSLPHGAVWDYHCLQSGVPAGNAWAEKVLRHERDVLSRRS